MALGYRTDTGFNLNLSKEEAEAVLLVLERTNGRDRPGVHEHLIEVANELRTLPIERPAPGAAFGYVTLVDKPLDEELQHKSNMQAFISILLLVDGGYLSSKEEE